MTLLPDQSRRSRGFITLIRSRAGVAVVLAEMGYGGLVGPVGRILRRRDGALEGLLRRVPQNLSSNPSGHTSLSMLVYGAVLALILARGGNWQKIVTVSAGIALALGIAISHMVIGAHSMTEIIMGMAIGAASLALFVAGSRRSISAALASWSLTVPSVMVVLLLNGNHLQAAELFRFLGLYLRNAGICG